MAININVDDYLNYGLGDIYYGLISFIGRYATDNYDPMEVLNLSESHQSKYALAIDTMKATLKELLDYFISQDEIYLPNVGRKIKISNLNFKDQKDLEDCCKYFIIMKLKTVMEQNQIYSDKQSIKR